MANLCFAQPVSLSLGLPVFVSICTRCDEISEMTTKIEKASEWAREHNEKGRESEQ